MVTEHELYELLFAREDGDRARHMWGTVAAVNADGSTEVKLNPSVATTCSVLSHVSVNVGDRALVLLFDKTSTVIGKV